jgi:hypothetical protein
MNYKEKTFELCVRIGIPVEHAPPRLLGDLEKLVKMAYQSGYQAATDAKADDAVAWMIDGDLIVRESVRDDLIGGKWNKVVDCGGAHHAKQ